MIARNLYLLLSKINRVSRGRPLAKGMSLQLAATGCVSNCIFCNIINENDPNKVVYNDNDVVAFTDIKPAAKFHYLVVPKRHIVDIKHVESQDKYLIEHLFNIGKRLLQEQNADLSDARFGFHWPPFHTVSHLHVHAISPASDMGFISRLIFKPNSYWFVSPEYVLSRL